MRLTQEDLHVHSSPLIDYFITNMICDNCYI